MNILFVCSRNQWRSPTGERIWRKHGFETRSAGTSPKAKHTLNAKDIIWADKILVMEDKHKDRLKASFKQLLQYKKVEVLDIEDNYQFMDDELVQIFENILEEY